METLLKGVTHASGSWETIRIRRTRCRKVHTWAKGVIRPLELVAGSKIITFRCNALEIVRVVLEAVGRK
jgi:hypothetical protein